MGEEERDLDLDAPFCLSIFWRIRSTYFLTCTSLSYGVTGYSTLSSCLPDLNPFRDVPLEYVNPLACRQGYSSPEGAYSGCGCVGKRSALPKEKAFLEGDLLRMCLT